MAAQTEVRIAGNQHLGVDRTVRIVTGDTAFAHGTVFVDERALLLGVTLDAGFVLRLQIHTRAAMALPLCMS